MANNYYTLLNSEMYENSPAVVNFQRHSIDSISYVGISRNQMTQSLSAGHIGSLTLYSLVIKGATKAKCSSNLFGDIRKYLKIYSLSKSFRFLISK